MIRKLRRKFILIAMLSVTMVLVVLIGTINFLNYRSVVEDADMVLEMLVTNDGTFPDRTPVPSEKHYDSPIAPANRRQMSPEMRFEARFFSIVLDKNGNAVNIDTGRIAAIDSSEARTLAENVFKTGKAKGFSGGYRFLRSDDEHGTIIVFYDCGRAIDIAKVFLIISVLISIIGLIFVYVLIAIFSKFMIKPAAEAYEKQKRFITDAGHELKTPLAVINADCDVLEMSSGNSDNEWLTDIRKQTERLTELTNSLIYLAKTEEGAKNAIVKIEFPLSDVVTEEVESFSGPAKASGKTIKTEITPDITYKGDQKSIAQLVSILMDNAIKYSPEGGVIKADLHRNGSKMIFAVTNDTIDPVTKDNMKHMFDRFYRSDESRNSETGGYGIGLSIAKSVTESHGGKITASGSGNRITITAEL